MTDNPTGAENAQVQDADERAHDKAIDVINAAFSDPSGSILHGHIVDALREAEQRGMLRAKEIARTYGEWCKNWGEVRNEIAARECAKEIAEAIERPATQKED